MQHSDDHQLSPVVTDAEGPTQPLMAAISALLVVADGCTSQFHCKNSFLWIQVRAFSTRGGFARDFGHAQVVQESFVRLVPSSVLRAFVQFRHVAHHGKADVDSAGNLERNLRVNKAASQS